MATASDAKTVVKAIGEIRRGDVLVTPKGDATVIGFELDDGEDFKNPGRSVKATVYFDLGGRKGSVSASPTFPMRIR